MSMGFEDEYIRREFVYDIYANKKWHPFDELNYQSMPISAWFLANQTQWNKNKRRLRKIESFYNYKIERYPRGYFLSLSLNKIIEERQVSENRYHFERGQYKLSQAAYVRIYRIDDFTRDVVINVTGGRLRFRYTLALL